MGSAGSMLALGYFVGPPVGGALFSVAGFSAPFLINGALVALCALPVLVLYPSSAGSPHAAPPTELESAHGELSRGASAAAAAAPAAAAASVARPTLRLWLRVLRQLPVDVWLVATLSLLYFSKWGWWDMWFTSWVVNEFSFTISGAALCISLIAGCFGERRGIEP